MSHTSKYKTTIKNVDLLCKIAKNQFSYKVKKGIQQVCFWGGSQVGAIASIEVDGWKFPIAITENGEIFYDHFGSKPDSIQNFGRLIQKYSIELIIAKIPLEKIQHAYVTEVKETGDKVLTLEF